MPTLISNYQKQVLAKQLKANYSLLSQGFQKMMADEGVTCFDQTPFYAECMAGTPRCQEIARKYFNVVGKVEYNPKYDKRMHCFYNIDGNWEYCKVGNFPSREYYTNRRFALSNGAFVDFVSELRPLEDKSLLYVSLDTNGAKGPNIIGYDYFIFEISNAQARLFADNFTIGGTFRKILDDNWEIKY